MTADQPFHPAHADIGPGSGSVGRRPLLGGVLAGAAGLALPGMTAPAADAAVGPTRLYLGPVNYLAETFSQIFWDYNVVDTSGPNASYSGMRRMNKTGAPGSSVRLNEFFHGKTVSFGGLTFAMADGRDFGWVAMNQAFGEVTVIWRVDPVSGATTTVCNTPNFVGNRRLVSDSGGMVFWSDASGIRSLRTNSRTPETAVAVSGVTDLSYSTNHLVYAVGSSIHAVTFDVGAPILHRNVVRPTATVTGVCAWRREADGFPSVMWTQADGAVKLGVSAARRRPPCSRPGPHSWPSDRLSTRRGMSGSTAMASLSPCDDGPRPDRPRSTPPTCPDTTTSSPTATPSTSPHARRSIAIASDLRTRMTHEPDPEEAIYSRA